MNKIESLEKALAQHGLTQFTRLLIKKSGVEFTPQQINNWRTRGVPYRWQDDVKKLIKVDKSALRN